MMADYIDRQTAIVTAVKAAIDWHKLANPQYSIAYCIGEAMRELPSADIDLSGFSDKLWKTAYERGKAEAVRHGRWIYDRLITTTGGTYGVRRCSECESYYQDVGYGFNYCPHCGALMDEVAQ